MNKTDIAQIFDSQSVSTNSWLLIVFSVLLAFGVGLFLFWVYKKTYRGVMFSTNFGMTLVLMTIITTPVVLCIKNSIELSMGMVGALSIVRFRTAIKDPIDTAYLFWALTMGILIGASEFFLAAMTAVCIAGCIFLMRYIGAKPSDNYLLVMHLVPGVEGRVAQLLKGVKYQKMKSKTITRNGVEVTYEVRLEHTEPFMNKLTMVEGVQEASLIAYQAETA